jgi:hypothetical protein
LKESWPAFPRNLALGVGSVNGPCEVDSP